MCTGRVCPTIAVNTTTRWNATFAGDTAIGTCQAGYRQSDPETPPTRLCNLDGTWDAAISDPCERACSSSEPLVLAGGALTR